MKHAGFRMRCFIRDLELSGLPTKTAHRNRRKLAAFCSNFLALPRKHAAEQNFAISATRSFPTESLNQPQLPIIRKNAIFNFPADAEQHRDEALLRSDHLNIVKKQPFDQRQQKMLQFVVRQKAALAGKPFIQMPFEICHCRFSSSRVLHECAGWCRWQSAVMLPAEFCGFTNGRQNIEQIHSWFPGTNFGRCQQLVKHLVGCAISSFGQFLAENGATGLVCPPKSAGIRALIFIVEALPAKTTRQIPKYFFRNDTSFPKSRKPCHIGFWNFRHPVPAHRGLSIRSPRKTAHQISVICEPSIPAYRRIRGADASRYSRARSQTRMASFKILIKTELLLIGNPRAVSGNVAANDWPAFFPRNLRSSFYTLRDPVP